MSFNPLSVSLGPPLLYKHSPHFNVQPPQPPGTTTAEENYDSEEEALPPQVPVSTEPKPVDNYSGKYTKEEVLALHRLDYPIPFIFEEVITSTTPLHPVATYKYRRLMDASLKDTNNNWEGSFFTLGKSTKGRGRGKRFVDDHGLAYSNFTDPRLIRSEPNNPPNLVNSSAPTEWNPQNGPLSTSFLSSQTTGTNTQYPPNSYLYYLLNEELLDDEKWYYKDPKGQERGPFGAIQMDKWVKFDFFKVDLLVRREYQPEFIHLGDVFFSEQRNPFTGEPLMEWFLGPSSEFKTSLMLLIQNFLLNRMKPDLDLSTSTGSFIPPQPFYPATISTKDSSVPTNNTPIQEPVNPAPSSIPRPEKWWESSDIPKRSQSQSQSTIAEKSSTSATTNENDWENLQEKQTKALQQMLEDMKLANEENEKKLQQNFKKKKGKKKESQATTAASTSSSTTTTKKKSKSVKLNNTQHQPPKANNTQKNNKPQSEKNSNNKPQPQPQPQQIERHSSKKPKPQYKLKESSNPEQAESQSNPTVPVPVQASPSQQSKRQHIKPPKVWKLVEKRDDNINQDQPNIEHHGGDEEKITQGHL